MSNGSEWASRDWTRELVEGQVSRLEKTGVNQWERINAMEKKAVEIEGKFEIVEQKITATNRGVEEIKEVLSTAIRLGVGILITGLGILAGWVFYFVSNLLLN